MSAALLARALMCCVALMLDAKLGEPRRWHPLAGFGRMAQMLERRCYYGSASVNPYRQRLHGLCALALAVLPWTWFAYALAQLPYLGLLAEVLGLYAAIGRHSLGQHAMPVAKALERDDLPEARRRVAMLVSRDTRDLPAEGISKACVESVLENGCDAIFGALFWFCLAGLPGVVFYRLVNTLDAMWGYKTERYLHFGWAAARLDDVLNYLPARGTALAYCLVGQAKQGLHCWRQQAPAWKSPNAGPVMAAGAGALNVFLGGEAVYAGHLEQRPALGVGLAPKPAHIGLALRLLDRALLLWLVVLILGGGLLA